MSAFANVAGRRGDANNQRPVLHMPQVGNTKDSEHLSLLKVLTPRTSHLSCGHEVRVPQSPAEYGTKLDISPHISHLSHLAILGSHISRANKLTPARSS